MLLQPKTVISRTAILSLTRTYAHLMEVLLLAFANSREHPLPTLAGEYSALNKILSPRLLRQHFTYLAFSHATLAEIAHYLTQFRDRLSLFLFSGHAGRDRLLTEDGVSRAAGVAHLLGQCKKLKVVILNGCSTSGQVAALHAAGVPLVIATSAPVGDEIAAQFSERLFHALETGLSIGEAFEQAIGEALGRRDIQVERGIGFRSAGSADGPLWGIFPNPDRPDASGWKLSSQVVVAQPVNFKVNDILLEVLYDTFSVTNPALRELAEAGRSLENNFGDIRAAILKALPAPIGERIRKLVAPSSETDGFDQIGLPRLGQLALTYETTMRFLANLLLAQVWENQISHPGDWSLPPLVRAGLQRVIDAGVGELAETSHFAVIQQLVDAVECRGHQPFITELLTFRTDFLDDAEIFNACLFLENLRRLADTAAPHELPELCLRAEESLAMFFSKLGFLGGYLLATVRNINVLKYRSKKDTEYEHLLTKWHDAVGTSEQDIRKQGSFMDNRSVVLLHQEVKSDQAALVYPYLSLAPFIIDLNTFRENADMQAVTLYFFTRRSAGTGSLVYKFVNNPEQVSLDLDADPEPGAGTRPSRHKKPNKFQLAKDQFEEFYSTIVNPPSADAR